jgi:hypothetical protein
MQRRTLGVPQTVRIALCGVIATFAVATANGATTCPPSVVRFERFTPTSLSTGAVAFDTVLTYTEYFIAHPAFDRSIGRVSLSAGSFGRLLTSVRAVECFDVIGVPTGTPVDGELRFQVDLQSEQSCGGSGCGVQFDAMLALPSDSVQADANLPGPGGTPKTVSTMISLPIHFVAGTPVTAQFLLYYGTGPGQTDAHAVGSGAWSIAGLPPGVRAISASGLDPTPVLRHTWGELKSLYHRGP